MYQHILLAYDGSDHARKAAGKAAEIATADGAHVTILIAYPSISPFFLGSKLNDAEVIRYWEEKAAEIQPLFKQKSISIDTVIQEEDPKKLILDKAAELEVDLIVMGSRGLSNYERLMLGGVSQTISQHAECDVLLVK
ncbi:universal stress protein [Aneurinibacillus sp. Ricciae_BoGa-3]|uniref:universal stress protein n=1 Tax=Aneurinibacillus sp. Ricciae_BoGa-3 TaxID=3022697 RepID=UPI002341F156|nr:universal stress protein [Aneurinibacillus sp. Ricciae_BoGa-3]WCK54393.1 universal stress protein [Aneurinibacillus sp. Ricciae_BoGa-3]